MAKPSPADIDQFLDEEIARQFKATVIDHGPLYDAIEAMAKKGGMQPPRVFLSSSKIPNAAALLVLRPGPGRIVITEGSLALYGATKYAPVNPEVLTDIAHEMGHIKQGVAIDLLLYRGLPMYALPVACVVGRHIWLHNRNTNKEECQNDKLSILLDHGLKDATVATGGFIGANYIARYRSLTSEYFADRFSAELVSPEAAISSLKKQSKALNRELFNKIPDDDPFKALTFQRRGGDTLWEWVMNWKKGNIHAHPSLEDRVARLEAMKEEIARTAEVAKPATALIAKTFSTFGKVSEMVLPLIKIRI